MNKIAINALLLLSACGQAPTTNMPDPAALCGPIDLEPGAVVVHDKGEVRTFAQCSGMAYECDALDGCAFRLSIGSRPYRLQVVADIIAPSVAIGMRTDIGFNFETVRSPRRYIGLPLNAQSGLRFDISIARGAVIAGLGFAQPTD